MGIFNKKQEKESEKEEVLKEDVNIQQDEIRQDHYIAQNPAKRRQYVENCCEQMIEAEKRLEELKKEYQLVNSYLSDVQIISTLPENQKDKVVEQAKRIIVFHNDRNEFAKSEGKLTYKQYADMEENGEEIQKIMKTLSEDEEYCHSVRTDMKYLEGEKLGLRMEKKELRKRLESMAKLAKWTFIILLFLLFGIWIYYCQTGEDVANMIYAVVAIGIILTAVIFGIHRHTLRELKTIEARLNKAITLLNKIKLKYVNVASRLEYMYEKHGVKSSVQLGKVWNRYLQEKKKQQIYRKTSDKLLDAEDKLVKILTELGVKDADVWISQADAILEQSEMFRLKEKLQKRREKVKTTMDYNMDVIEKSKVAIKELIENNKKYAKEIMIIVDSYH